MTSNEDRAHVPADLEQARKRMGAAPIPGPVLAVARRLHQAGHAAVLVGGAVRDALRGHPQDDWDLATSATPDEVQSIFPRTIPTGVEHGTVTVLSGKGDARSTIEVTTFRGEGAYHDGRRPSQVHFLRDLEEDLARRDFTINAIAWDPNTATLTDAFGGLEDLRAGIVRAVGDPKARFREDGLRAMRAVRFAAGLGFSLERETELAIPTALDVFARVSRERVRVELVKLLAARRPSMGLAPMARTGLWDLVLIPCPDEVREQAIAACDELPAKPMVRLARLFMHAAGDAAQVEETLDSLRPSKTERKQVLSMLSDAAQALVGAREPVDIRRAAATLGRDRIADVCDLHALADPARAAIADACQGAPLSVKELAVQGRDLIGEGLMRPGPAMGEVLGGLLDWVLVDPSRNHRQALLAQARVVLDRSAEA